MNFAVLSDIHGNAPALSAVLNDIDRRGISHIFCLGDVAGYCCQINECIEMLRDRGISNLMGNHDSYLIHDAVCSRSTSATRCLKYQRDIILERHLDWLAASETMRSFGNVSMVHAGWNDPLEEYLYSIPENYFSDIEATFFFSGHTHVQGTKRFDDGRIYTNPGSVGQPRDGNPDAAYAIYQRGKISLVRVAYDITEIERVMSSAGFEPHYYEHLRTGSRIGGTIDTWNRPV